MRTIGEIQAAVHEALSEGSVEAISGISTAELCMCVEAQVVLRESLRSALEGLITVVYNLDGNLGLETIANRASDVCDQVDDALGATLDEWLMDPETGDLC
jgi:hypothetical protein